MITFQFFTMVNQLWTKNNICWLLYLITTNQELSSSSNHCSDHQARTTNQWPFLSPDHPQWVQMAARISYRSPGNTIKHWIFLVSAGKWYVDNIFPFHIWDVKSFPTDELSMIFQRGFCQTTNQLWHPIVGTIPPLLVPQPTWLRRVMAPIGLSW